ncbi:MAG: hypothetical protein NTW10_12620 [Bacteroidetes bacterium]|nr:hypothetical protein [Bacteroidota bacterium]
MNKEDLNGQVQQVLIEFESLGEIRPSSGWDQNLMNKLNTARHYTGAGSAFPRYTLLVAFIILINVGLFLKFVIHDLRQPSFRSEQLKSISTEFLINPTSETR